MLGVLGGAGVVVWAGEGREAQIVPNGTVLERVGHGRSDDRVRRMQAPWSLPAEANFSFCAGDFLEAPLPFPPIPLILLHPCAP